MDITLKEIDSRFLNSETSGRFTNCLVCHKNVIESREDYFIEKIIRNIPKLNLSEALFEYAICMNCAHDLRNNLSEHSLLQMEKYFLSNAKISSRMALNLEGNESTQECLFTGKKIGDCDEYALHAYCREDKMLVGAFPYAVSDAAMDEMSELLSNETLDELDNFKRTYFKGPPEMADLINPKRLIPF